MPHISSKDLEEKQEKILKKKLMEVFHVVGKDRHSSWALRELLSRTEIIMLAKRFSVIYLISKEVPTLRIAETLKVSSSTVIRIQKKFDRGGFKFLDKTFKKAEPSLIKIIETILGAGLPPIAGPGRWKFLDKYK